MATTTNYSWTTPDDTDLVKDGASAIRTLGSAIDTTVYNNANAAIAKSIVDAKGDIIAGTGSDTVSRLAVGTDGYVLTADSTVSTGLKWAAASAGGGGWTQISSTSLSGASVSFTGISGSYNSLLLVVKNQTNNTADGKLRITPNSTGGFRWSGTSAGSVYNQTGSVQFQPNTTMARTDSNNVFTLQIWNYTDSSEYGRGFMGTGYYWSGSAETSLIVAGTCVVPSPYTAVTSLTIDNSGGTFSGGTAILYGL
jgi:hypothetical protein